MVAVLALAVASLTALPAATAPVPGSSCRVFPGNSIWNADVSKLPVNAHSAMWLGAMHAGSTLLHPDFGRAPYGFPFVAVGNAHPLHHVRFLYADESDAGPYPFGPGTPIEGGRSSDGDRHALMLNRESCKLYELYDAHWNDGHPKAGSGAIFDLGSNRLRPNGWTSADAAGLPILPGLVRYDEVRAGAIRHAIRFTAECSAGYHLWPARHDAASGGPKCPPMGARFRLKAGYDMSHYGPRARVILRAMKHYGLILADNGSDWFFQGTRDRRWSDTLLDQLKRVPAKGFVAVDESGCRVKRRSARSRCS